MASSYNAVPISGEGRAVEHPLFPLVLALFTLGVEIVGTSGFAETVEVVGDEGDERELWRFTWLLKEKSRDGRHETDKLIKAWLDPERKWFKANPEHPFTYLEAAHRQAIHVRAALVDAVAYGVVRKGEKMVLIPLDATEAETAELMAKLD